MKSRQRGMTFLGLITILLFATSISMMAAAVLAQQSGATASARRSVAIKDMQFNPATLEINVGDTVVWTNNDDRDHTVVGPTGSFKSENLRAGASYSYQFTKAGTFGYGCSYHPRMKGTITVKEKPQEAKVIAVGTGKVGEDGKKIPLDVKAGDRILFGKYSGSEVKIDDEEYLILREEDVLGILD